MKTFLLIAAICFQTMASTVVSMTVMDTLINWMGPDSNGVRVRLIQNLGAFCTSYTVIPLKFPGLSYVENPRRLALITVQQPESNPPPIFLVFYGDSGTYDQAYFAMTGHLIGTILYYPAKVINPIPSYKKISRKYFASFDVLGRVNENPRSIRIENSRMVNGIERHQWK